MGEIVIIGIAVVAAAIAFAVSPFVRVVCWDCMAHPRHRCTWIRDSAGFREIKDGPFTEA